MTQCAYTCDNYCMEDEKTHVKSYEWLKPYQFKVGNPGGPGRPKGPTLKSWIKEHFSEMTDEERIEFLNKIEPIKAWEMAEGKAETKSTVDAKVEHSVDPEVKQTIDKALEEII